MIMHRTDSVFLCLLLACVGAVVSCSESNQRVILGVLSEESGKDHQYIAASYIKYVEAGGARAVPIFVGQPKSYYQKLASQLNGVLLPGGGVSLVDSQYGQAASTLIDLAIEMYNKNQTYFPVWGTCLSFEKLITYFVGNNSWITKCEVENVSLNLDIEKKVLSDSNSTRLFREDREKMLKIVQNNPISANYHRVCLTKKDFYRFELDKEFVLISTNTYGGIKFVSTIEHLKYPIYATAWHPEKNLFEFTVNAHRGNITHDENAVLVGQYFANFLVNEARNNSNHFANKLDEINALIFNYHQYLVYTGKEPNASFDEIYRFPNKVASQWRQSVWSVLFVCLVVSHLSLYHIHS